MKRRDALGGLVVGLFGVLTILLSLQMPIGTFRAAGSGLFPLSLGLLLVLLSALYVGSLWLQSAPSAVAPARVEAPGPLLGCLGVLALAPLLLQPLGYPLVAFLLMLALLRILGIRRWRVNVLVSLGTAAVAYVLFVRWLQIPLPKGWLGL
jgi:putative tricarboxylic transport membrane protein